MAICSALAFLPGQFRFTVWYRESYVTIRFPSRLPRPKKDDEWTLYIEGHVAQHRCGEPQSQNPHHQCPSSMSTARWHVLGKWGSSHDEGHSHDQQG